MFLTKKIADLQAQLELVSKERDSQAAGVAALNLEITELKASNTALEAANAQCEERHNADQLTLTSVTAERDELKGQVATLTATNVELTTKVTAVENNVDTKVREKLGSSGVPAVTRDPGVVKGGQMTRAEFSELSPHARAEFCRRGGRLVD